MTDSFSSTAREMPLLLGRLGDAHETLLLIGIPDRDGIVHVRGWSAEDWGAAPRSRAERANGLLDMLERQAELGRSMNQSIYAIRLWLRGEGIAPR
ncbi:MAG: hypothetical protein JWM95_1888 [Gemmatimonadetes bacterium]|nr:hypothetical protein [Gemmatimonadota bacterium]